MLGLAAAALATPRRGLAQIALAEPSEAGAPTLTVAGPGDSEAAHWARLLQAPLAAGLLAPDSVRLRFVGGRDGVTGVNQFDARAMPDGAEAVLFPGSVGLAVLAGDSRVRFDAAHLLPLLACAGEGVLMVRGGLAAGRARPIRLACPSRLHPAAAALLTLDLLGIPALPVQTGPDLQWAASSGAADAVFVTGPGAMAHVRDLTQAGLTPVFRMPPPYAPAASPSGIVSAAGLIPRQRLRDDALARAWPAFAAASVTGVTLAVPQQSPSGAVARWRTACGAAMMDRDVTADSQARGLNIVCDEQAERTLAALRLPEPAQAALRNWLSVRLNWQPG